MFDASGAYRFGKLFNSSGSDGNNDFTEKENIIYIPPHLFQRWKFLRNLKSKLRTKKIKE